MRIDSISTLVQSQAIEHTIFTGTKYAFYRTAGASTVGDPYGMDEKFYIHDKRDGVSVLFTAEELEAFRPTDTVHGFLRGLKAQDEARLDYLKKNISKQPTEFKSLGKVYNIQEIWQDEINYLETHWVRFIKIIFV